MPHHFVDFASFLFLAPAALALKEKSTSQVRILQHSWHEVLAGGLGVRTGRRGRMVYSWGAHGRGVGYVRVLSEPRTGRSPSGQGWGYGEQRGGWCLLCSCVCESFVWLCICVCVFSTIFLILYSGLIWIIYFSINLLSVTFICGHTACQIVIHNFSGQKNPLGSN